MRTKLFSLSIILLSSILLAGCDLNPFGKKAGIQITSNRQVEVSLNGESVGKTPIYQENNKPGNYTVQMSSSDGSVSPWEGKVSLTAGTLTYIDRQFGTTPDQNHGYTLTYEKLSNSKAMEISIVSIPTASVSIDNKPSGFTPLSVNDITEGPHDFILSAPGYQEKIIKANVRPGFKLLINAQLMVQPVIEIPQEATPSADITTITPTPTTTSTTKTEITPLPKQASASATLAKPYVEILSTPTGWLRVRADTSIGSEELAKVNPGDKFAIKETTVAGWYNIEYQKGEWGYISSQYAKLYE